MPRRAADGLDQRALRAQEAFLVGVEDRHQRHFGNVEPFAQQVDADQHVEFAEAQVADDLHALDRVDVRVQIAHLDAVLGQIVGQVLGHALGQRGHQHALVLVDAQLDLRQQVVDLRRGRAHLERRIDQAGRPHQLLDHLPRVRFFSYSAGVAETKIVCGSSRSNSSKRSGRLSSADGSRKP